MAEDNTSSDSCCTAFLREFRLNQLGYTDVVGWNDDFTRSWLIKDRRAFLKVRIALLVLIFALFVWSSLDMGVDGDYKYWWIYVTHWSLLVELLYFASAVYTQWRAEEKGEPSGRWWVYLSWILHDIAYPASFFVTVNYWLLVYSPPLRAISTFTHGVNFVVILADTMLSSQAYRLSHGVYFLLYAIVYIIWSLIFHAAKATNQDGNRYIYSSLDYKEDAGGAVVTIAIALIGVLVIILPLLWMVTYIRTQRSNKSKLANDSMTNMPATTVDNLMSI
uniref:Uncharacterized protein n=1 Tax=Pyramimonas obovata TaxID=1411642 RepID=A0A7S0N942_9CHLO|mmetsp:Transcript_23151/g.50741  ORF Transcript_23151/g.50741 Transcript_23151/m.50741 type:complete len:277 (+) Transcript_23151:295-1125(+)|eukprot:CAMPEP_0118929232 /NCGR_PEP_ID=MMETSP1169-20130426/6285_1 /TAXON_ID=36882 /ORGANISM="Pyramimonas obovata, Strain CCMP722" /LENGTH=276 /DNA_ID=CAMNT_0006871383 /DNA_START=241 /DNA_END=1071 /DNA_ORIENTATION=-